MEEDNFDWTDNVDEKNKLFKSLLVEDLLWLQKFENALGI